MNPLQEQFITEARELVAQATDDLIAMEREGPASERIDRIFRAFHTLKGSAGLVDLPAMSLTLHAAEDLLAAIHAGRLAATSAVVDQALECLDQVSHWVDDFEAQGSLPPRAGEDARAMADALREHLPEHPTKALGESGGEFPAPAGAGALPVWVSSLIESQDATMSQRMQQHAAGLFAISYEPHAGCFFDGTDPLRLMRQVPDLLAFHIEARQAWAPLADMDPYSCNLRLQCLSAGDRAELADIFRLVPDQVRIVEVPLEAWRREERVGDDEATASLVRAVIEEQRQMLHISDQGEDAFGRIGAATRAAANALRYHRKADMAERMERAGALASSQGNAAPLVSVLDAAFEALAPASSDADGVRGASIEPPVAPTTGEPDRSGRRSLRVDESKIDALVNLAGELIVVKNGFAHLAKRLGAEAGGEELARLVRRDHDAIERIAGEMNAAILQLRMVPIGQVFRSFPRLVRDMSRQLDKKVALVTRGETTEVDKTVVDLLFEPLLHLVRNALDHGIETPDQRRSAGKSETASITMQASRAGDRLVVEIIDDGGGIDPDIVRRMARERGMLSIDELAALSDEQAVDLIFSAGFSTAARISDISGRGVGMDVVRTVVERVGGRVSVASRVGAGTSTRLELPLNIAISRIMVVEAGGQVFGIPMDAVTETVRLTPDRISQIKTNEGFVLRNRVVPICPLAELMDLPKKPGSGLNARTLLITEIAGKIAALEVDAIGDRLEAVLKPMQGLLANARGYAGTTLLGDGRVLLVLDLKEILP
jgi:two-component system, chemotaxis family, sensor kinase CheA